ncbi:MAG: hypothetical protein ACLT33_04410 [Lachnospira pectinoschiza]
MTGLRLLRGTSIDVNVTRNTSDASKVLFDQTAVITVTYHYDTVLSYPDYVKTTTLTTNTFEAEEREEDVSGTKQTVYYVSGKIKKNIKNLYVFYTPFDDYISTNKKGTTTTDGTMEVYVNDKINVTYKYPAELTNVRYSDLNVYLLEQKKITQEKNADGSVASAQKYRMLVDHNKVKVHLILRLWVILLIKQETRILQREFILILKTGSLVLHQKQKILCIDLQ